MPKLFGLKTDSKDGAIIAPTLSHVLETIWLLAHPLKGGEKSFGCDGSRKVEEVNGIGPQGLIHRKDVPHDSCRGVGNPSLGNVQWNPGVCVTHEGDEVLSGLEDNIQSTSGEANALVPGEVKFLWHKHHSQPQDAPNGFLDAEGVVSGEPRWCVRNPFHPGVTGFNGVFIIDRVANAHSQVMFEVYHSLF